MSVRFWPGIQVAGRRHEVTAQSQAPRVQSSPCGIHTSAGRSRLARRESLSVSGAGRKRPAFCFGGWKPASWKTWTAALCRRLRSPAQRHTAALQTYLQSSNLLIVRCSTWDSCWLGFCAHLDEACTAQRNSLGMRQTGA